MMNRRFWFLFIIYLSYPGLESKFHVTLTKFHSRHIAIHCISSQSNTRSLVECGLLFMRDELYNYAFVYRDGCHFCRSPLGKTNDVNPNEYMFQGPHHVKGMETRYFVWKWVILPVIIEPQPGNVGIGTNIIFIVSQILAYTRFVIIHSVLSNLWLHCCRIVMILGTFLQMEMS